MSGSDRELLELAAKAIGYEPRNIFAINGYSMGIGEDSYRWWNPLTDDGDALRLAVKLALFNGAKMFHFRSLERFENPEADEIEWTRRAIVRAAAEIGMSLL